MSARSVNYNISGIIPYENYTYLVENVASNWPVKINPLSGTINAISNSINISNKVDFCDNLSSCIGYMSYNTGSYKLGDEPFADLRIKLSSPSLDQSVYSDTIQVICSGCAPVPKITIPSGTLKLNTNTTNATGINFIFNNLKPHTTYTYSFNDMGSNYPVVLTSIPSTGTFLSSSGTSYTLRADLSFCYYDNCDNAVFGANSLSKIEQQQCEKYYSNFNLLLNSSYLTNSIISETVSIECNDCFPKPTISIPSTINLTPSTFNRYVLSTSFSGLKPYNRYDYTIVHDSSNHMVSFSSLSGYFYTKNETSKNIETKVVFCEGADLCEYSNNLGSIIDYDCSKNKYIDFHMELDSSCLESNIQSDIIRINCDNCLPRTTISTPNKIVLTRSLGNLNSFNVTIDGLKPYSEYSYVFKNFDTNHLIGLKEVSGVAYTKNSTSLTIPNTVVFCENDTYCNAYTTVGIANSDICNNILSASFILELDGNCLPQPISSDKIEIDCIDCIPIISVSLPSTASLTSSNLMSLTGSVSSLKPYQSYDYYFTGENNWPVILDNASGSFVANSSTQTISTKVLFCSNSGLCQQENGLLPYSLSSPVQKILNNNMLYSKLKLNIKSSSCADTVYTSNVSTVECNNCIPCTRYANVVFSESPVITLDEGCCLGQKLLTVNITNGVPGDKYTYKFSTPSGLGVNSITFNPVSGEMYFGGAGGGSINTICNVNLINNTKTLLNFELTHDITNIKIIDSVILACSDGSC